MCSTLYDFQYHLVTGSGRFFLWIEKDLIEASVAQKLF